MTNLEILERLSRAGLLSAEESVTIARRGEGESVSITMDHPVVLAGGAADAETLARRIALSYDAASPVMLLAAEDSILSVSVGEFAPSFWRAGMLFFFDARKAVAAPVSPYSLAGLLATMDRLIAPDGCPWDSKQTHESLRTYFLQETYEVIDAIGRKDWENLREELGDVLYQVVFHARLAEREGHFTMQDVADGIDSKMRRRHPFLFGEKGENGDAWAAGTWEKRKRAEKNRKYLLSGVPKALPSLLLSCIIQKKVGSSGLGDILPETDAAELETICQRVLSAESTRDRELGAGLLLFTIGRVLRGKGLEPELALRRFTLEFMACFHAFEREWERQGKSLDASTPEEILAGWRRFTDHPGEP